MTTRATVPPPWRLLEAAGGTVATGATTMFGDDAASGDHVHQVDLSTVPTSGTYRLEVAGVAGHPHEVAGCFKGADERGTTWPGCGYTLDVTGGWYDAGDHGKYVVNGGIALWTL